MGKGPNSGRSAAESRLPGLSPAANRGPRLQHMEVPRLGVKSELHLLAYTPARATDTTAHGNAGSPTH